MNRACENCGGGLLLVRAGARFCSTRCRVAAHRRLRSLPVELTSRDRWVRARGKRPVTVHGAPASSTNPDTWSSHAAVLRSSAGDGFGVMLGGGLGCWDLDGCLVDGVLSDDGRRILDAIEAPVIFTEVSVSGRGLHVFTLEPEAKASQGAWGGHYTHSRFIRTTGVKFIG